MNKYPSGPIFPKSGIETVEAEAGRCIHENPGAHHQKQKEKTEKNRPHHVPPFKYHFERQTDVHGFEKICWQTQAPIN